MPAFHNINQMQQQDVPKRNQRHNCCYCLQLKPEKQMTKVPTSEEWKNKWIAILGDRFAKNMKRKKDGRICKTHFANPNFKYRKRDTLPIKMTMEEEQALFGNASCLESTSETTQNFERRSPNEDGLFIPSPCIFGQNFFQIPRPPFVSNTYHFENIFSIDLTTPIDFVSELCEANPIRNQEDEEEILENVNQHNLIGNDETRDENSRVVEEELGNVEMGEIMSQEVIDIVQIGKYGLLGDEDLMDEQIIENDPLMDDHFDRIPNTLTHNIAGEEMVGQENVEHQEAYQAEIATTQNQLFMPLPPFSHLASIDFTTNDQANQIRNREEQGEYENARMLVGNYPISQNQLDEAENDQTPGEMINGRILGGELGNLETGEIGVTMPQAAVRVKIEPHQVAELAIVVNEDPEIEIFVPIRTEAPTITTATCRVCGRICDISTMSAIPTRSQTLLKWMTFLGNDFINNLSNNSPNFICGVHVRHMLDQACRQL